MFARRRESFFAFWKMNLAKRRPPRANRVIPRQQRFHVRIRKIFQRPIRQAAKNALR